MSFGCLVDIAKCIGCRTCQIACRNWHHQPTESLRPFDRYYELDQPELSALDRTVVKFTKFKDRTGKDSYAFSKRQCMHCLEPACASACPVRALRKTPEGPVIYREDLCFGCRYCMVACPFNVPRFDYDKVVPSIRKCTFCAAKTTENTKGEPKEQLVGKIERSFSPEKKDQPSCASRCPGGALRFGDRDELLSFANLRIKSQRNIKYVQHIYGEHEVGGTGWLYISNIPFEELGFDMTLGSMAFPEYTKPFLTGVPLVIILGSGLMTGLYWIIKRRDELAPDNGLPGLVNSTNSSSTTVEGTP